jgi:hypothetical protein
MNRRLSWLVAGCILLGTAAWGSAPVATSAAVVPECGTSVLRASIGGSSAGAGNIYTTLVLRNVGHATCFTQGYPGISLVDRNHRQLGAAALRVAAPTKRVVLKPGGKASTVIHTLNPGVGTNDCVGPSVSMRVYPPDQFASILVPVHLSECLGVLEVRPLVAGSAGM